MPRIELGDEVKDRINGATGIVTGRSEYLHGCTQLLVCPTALDKEGKTRDSFWQDEQRLEIVKAKAFKPQAQSATGPGPGGPRSDAPKGRK